MPLEFKTTGVWELDDNGFMRARARFLASGIMQYGKKELGQSANMADPEDKIYNIFVGDDTLGDAHAIRSLEGMPVVSFDHVWIDGDTRQVQVGSIAGTPKVNGPFLEGEIVITDPLTIKALQDGTLRDISAAYQANYIMDAGEHDGKIFDGKQTDLRYNHIALLKPGTGRGGHEVRILNKERESIMSDKMTAIQLATGQTVRVHNEDCALLNGFLDSARKIKTQNDDSGFKLEEAMNNLTELKKVQATNQEEIDKVTGELTATKEALENALNPEQVEAAAAELMEEKEEGVDLLTANAEEKKEEALNSIKGLSGHSLRLYVVNKIRTFNKHDALDKGTSENEAMVKGYYSALKSMPASKKRVVNGGSVASKIQNAVQRSTRRSGTAALGYTQKKEA